MQRRCRGGAGIGARCRGSADVLRRRGAEVQRSCRGGASAGSEFQQRFSSGAEVQQRWCSAKQIRAGAGWCRAGTKFEVLSMRRGEGEMIVKVQRYCKGLEEEMQRSAQVMQCK